MGESPIFTTQAHVFHIDPNTKKNWIPASNQAVSVSYFFDTTRNSYRIISVDNNKAVINSTITPNMVFTKTSQKFGQWADPRANTIYGLGFATETDLVKFHEKFKEVKEATRIASQKQNGTLQSQLREDDSGNQSPKLRLHNSPGLIQTATPDSPKSPSTFPTTEAQLKYENEKLKIALAQSSANAKKWEQELETLNSNNKRLTTALQESTANVEEWKKQLKSFKEENVSLKEKLKAPELNDSRTSLTDEKEQELNSKIRRLENENEVKEKEINMLKEQLDELKAETVAREALEKKIQELEAGNQAMQQQLEEMDAELSDCRKALKEAAALQETLSSKMCETLELQKQIESTLKIS